MKDFVSSLFPGGPEFFGQLFAVLMKIGEFFVNRITAVTKGGIEGFSHPKTVGFVIILIDDIQFEEKIF